ncbi:hypothetical protein GOBAR_DD33127 [Gossypium barbadense]|nr:hypothetical protein GOBAR_DD33127 [Gossypium barbadense]
MMEQVPRTLGTSASLALRLGQTIFSYTSLLFMCLDVEFYNYTSFSQDQTTDIEDGFPKTPQVAPFTSADDTAPLLENGSSDDKLNFDGPIDFNEDLCRSSSFNGTMVGEENAVSMLTMQSITNLMKEVELQEAAAEQAKEEAARGAWIFSSRWRNLNRCCHMQRKQMTWLCTC